MGLSCYTGDRQYTLHIDNPHGDEDDDAAYPDNGMRMTVTYYINLNWNPTEGSSKGGLDVFLTDPKDKPSSGSSAKNAPGDFDDRQGEVVCPHHVVLERPGHEPDGREVAADEQ